MRSECIACEKVFRSVPEFDRHRTGEHGPGRRCMTTEEMIGKGWEALDTGMWRSPHVKKTAERLSNYFSESKK